MKNFVSSHDLSKNVWSFKLPNYDQIPDVGLFLKQTCQFINDSLAPFSVLHLTPSMISNYVKKGLIARPKKKRYSREQIAQLLFIAIAKLVLPLEDLKVGLKIQNTTYTTEDAYLYLSEELKNGLFYVFGLSDHLAAIGKTHTDEKKMLRNIILAVSHELYLIEYFAILRKKQL